MKIYIYTLSDPDTQEVRYVGKSKRPKRRLKEHLYVKSLENRKVHLSYWILSLLKQGKKPVMTIIDETEGDWEVLEKKWIKHYSNLCNLTEGGEGCHGLIQTTEHKEKRRQSMLGKNKGKKVPKEATESMLEKRKHRNKDPQKRALKYTLEQIKAVKIALLANSCKACIARELGVHHGLVYEIANNSKYSDVKI